MAETSSGVSASYVDSAVNSVRNELTREINNVKSELRNEINRLEREMREVGDMIVNELRNQTERLGHHLETQTVAVVGGVAANTLMLERTKVQIEEDFTKTRTKLDLQTEASLQVEVGKKIADSASTHGKLMAFARDISERFNKSIEGFFLNRQLYNVNFKKIFDEYANKIRTIGSHIFEIRDQDIAPAIKAAETPLEEIHSLPIEVDLMRLKIRSQNLDETLKILKDSRFDQVLNSLNSLEETLEAQFNLRVNENRADENLLSVVLATSSPISTDILVGQNAHPIGNMQSINLSINNDLAFIESGARQSLMNAVKVKRSVTPEEISKMVQAAHNLVKKNFLSKEGAILFEDFIASDNLKIAR